MRRIWIFAGLAALLLCGCSGRKEAPAPVGEPIPVGVERELPYTAVLPRAETAMRMISESPAGACWESPAGDCYWVTTLSGPDVDQALRELTGFSAEKLRPYRQERFGMEEYRFTWTTENEEGTYLCLGQLHRDENYCYGLAVCWREDADGVTRALCSEAYANYGLYYDEGA